MPPLSIHWNELTPMLQAEAGGAAGWLREELVIAGGTAWRGEQKVWLTETQIYNPAAKKWRHGPALPHAMAYGPSTSSGSGLEILGGTDGKTVFRESWRLDTTESQWTKTGEVPADVLLGRAARIGDDVYVVGGCPDIADLTRCSDAVWRRSADGQWQTVTKLPSGPVAMPAVAVHDRNIYVFGGCSMAEPGVVRNHDGAYRYDTEKNKWSSLRSLPQPNRGLSAVADGRRMYLLGGYTDKGFSPDVFAFDLSGQTYQQVAALPFALLGFELVVSGHSVYIAGGEDKPRGRSGRLLFAELPR